MSIVSKIKKEINKNISKIDVLYLICVAISFGVLMGRCKYGFSSQDEAFYLTIPYRLVQGDGLLVDEWHMSQMASFLMIPLVNLVVKLKGLTGIILIFRLIYVCVSTIASIIIFGLLRMYSKLGAALGAVAFLWYAPFGVNALSYNSMGIIALSVSTTLLISDRRIKFESFLAGVFLAFAVLCNPFLTMLYFGIVFAAVIWRSVQKEAAREYIYKAMWLSLGVVIVAIAFLIHILAKSPLTVLIRSLSAIFSFDATHGIGLGEKLISYWIVVLNSCSAYRIFFRLYYLLIALAFFAKKSAQKNAIIVISSIVFVANIVVVALTNNYINHIMFPINFVSLIFYIVYRNKMLDKVFWGIWIPGFVYSVCMLLASDTYIYAITSAGAVMILASAIFIGYGIEFEIKENNLSNRIYQYITLIVSVSVLVVQMGSEVYFRYANVYGENKISELTERTEVGPEAGICVTPETKEKYEKLFLDTQSIQEAEKVLFLSKNTWLYLCGEYTCGSYSAWLGCEGMEVFDRLDAYYELRPEKIPDAIFLLGDDTERIERCIEMGYDNQFITDNGNVILRRNEVQ